MDYKKIYEDICKRGQNREINDYTEKHHIVPKCMGGDNRFDNITKLTAKEHFLCHRLLCEIHPQNKELVWAFWLLAIGKRRYKKLEPYNVSARQYERARKLFIDKVKDQPISEEHKNKIGKSNSKTVYQFTLKGEFIKEWEGCSAAEKSIRNMPNTHWKKRPNNIDACCRGEQKTAYGFVWSYFKDYIELNQHKGNNTQAWKKLIKK